MAEKIIKTRIQLKHDTTANWNNATNFIPKAGEPIIYTDGSKKGPVFKIGDGKTKISELPFVGYLDDLVTTDTDQHITGSKYFDIEINEGTSKPFDIRRCGTSVFQVSHADIDGSIAKISIDDGQDGDVALYLQTDCGTIGQVLTSQGIDKTPIWTTPIKPRVTDVTVNGASVLNDSGVAAININALQCDYVNIATTDNIWVDYTINGTIYKAIRVEKTSAILSVFNSSNQRIAVQEVFDDNYLYICVGTEPIACTLRVISGNVVSTPSNNVLIDVSGVTMRENIDSTVDNPLYDYSINVRILSGELKVGDRIQLCKSVKKIKYNRDSNTGAKVKVRNVWKIVPFESRIINEEDLKFPDIYSLRISSEKYLFRSYSNSGYKKPLTVRICRFKESDDIYVPISNSVKLVTNYITKKIHLI